VLAEAKTEELVARSLEEEEPLRFDDQWWGHEGRDGLVLNLGFNQKVEAAALKTFVHIEPELPNLRIEPSYNNRRVQVSGTGIQRPATT